MFSKDMYVYTSVTDSKKASLTLCVVSCCTLKPESCIYFQNNPNVKLYKTIMSDVDVVFVKTHHSFCILRQALKS